LKAVERKPVQFSGSAAEQGGRPKFCPMPGVGNLKKRRREISWEYIRMHGRLHGKPGVSSEGPNGGLRTVRSWFI